MRACSLVDLMCVLTLASGLAGLSPASNPTTGWNVFLAKLNPAGDAVVYSTYVGGSCGHSVAVDSSGNAYVTGHAEPLHFPVVNAFPACQRRLPRCVRDQVGSH